MSEAADIMFVSEADGVRREADHEPWPAHLHIAREFIEEPPSPVIEVSGNHVRFNLRGDEATYRLEYADDDRFFEAYLVGDGVRPPVDRKD